MADPTLDTTSTYAGMSTNEMMESVLRRRGLSLDSDNTGRVAATATEQADILRYLRRAHTLFNTEFPESFSLERATGTWTAGDTAIMLPANTMAVLAFYLNGNLCYPIEMEDLRRGTTFDEDATNNMGFTEIAGKYAQYFWRISGVADADAVANGGAGAGPVDWRPVLQLYGIDPDNALTAVPYVIDFVRYGENFTAGTVPARVMPVVQEGVIARAAALWASEENDEVVKVQAMFDMTELENPLYAAFDNRGDTAKRARWTYPTPGIQKNTRRSS
jgi:hypothetical protein